jgi:hypothetical protein
VVDEHDATTCPLCGSPTSRSRSPEADQQDAQRPEREAPGHDENRTEYGPGVDAVHERVAALEQAVHKLRSALIGVAERQDEQDSLPCYCVGERAGGHQAWCVDARAALATTFGKRLGRLRRADDLWAALGLAGFGGSESPGDVSGAASSAAVPPTKESVPQARSFPDDADTVVEQVKQTLPAGDTGESGDRVACERCGGAHALEAKNTLLWYQCADGSFYLGGIDGRLLLPRAPDAESSS